MIAIENDKLTITISDGSPEELHERIVITLARAVRWYAHCPDKWKDDAQYLAVVSELMEQLQ